MRLTVCSHYLDRGVAGAHNQDEELLVRTVVGSAEKFERQVGRPMKAIDIVAGV